MGILKILMVVMSMILASSIANGQTKPEQKQDTLSLSGPASTKGMKYILKKDGVVYVKKDIGLTTFPNEIQELDNRYHVFQDGMVIRNDGTRVRLEEGEMMIMEGKLFGTVISGKEDPESEFEKTAKERKPVGKKGDTKI